MQPRVCAKCLVFSMATKCNQKPRAYMCDRARAHARRMLFFIPRVFLFFHFSLFTLFFGCLVAFFLKSASQIRRRPIPLQPSATKCNQTKPKFFNNSAPPSFQFSPPIYVYTYIGATITPAARRSSVGRTWRPAVCLSSPSRGDSGVSCQPRCRPSVKSS